MNVGKVTKELKEKYPGKNIVLNKNKEGIVTEIVCENDHPNGIAIAVIDSSESHYHKVSVETYKILRGGSARTLC